MSNPEHELQRCAICDGRGVVAILDKDEQEQITACPVCGGLGTL